MRIVLVSPFEAERSALYQLLVGDGHEVTAAATREEALRIASAAPPEVFIADAKVVALDGLALVRALSERSLAPRVILLCSRASRGCGKDGVVCLTKPIEIPQLSRALGQASLPTSLVA